MKCKSCGSLIFNEISQIDSESIDKDIDLLLQCENCGRYKFVKEVDID